MNIVFLGLPGTGKGTQAELVAEELSIPHIATGDIFRQAISQATDLGTKAKQYLDAGELVPDEVTCGIVEARLQEEDAQKGFILDGFPRTLPQARELDTMLKRSGRQLQGIIYFDAPEDILLSRLTGRRVCRDCGATYHLIYRPPQKEQICDSCGGELYQRRDDDEETIKNRLAVNRENTRELMAYYKEDGRLWEINAQNEMAEVTQDLLAILRRLV